MTRANRREVDLKSALELLGKVRDAEFTNDDGTLVLSPEVFTDWLELVAQRAREEMKRACMDVVDAGWTRDESHATMLENIRALKVAP
jgi:hypothetical protein